MDAVETSEGKNLCPFCRAPVPSLDEEVIDRLEKRIDVGDAYGIYNCGCYYSQGSYGLPHDVDKALELWNRAADLGCATSYYNIGCSYLKGSNGVERDRKKALHYMEIAAMGGDVTARYGLGLVDWKAGNYERAVKHLMIAIEFGNNESLKIIKQMYKDGHARKDVYAKALGAYQTYLGEVKSVQRDEAAAFNNRYKYY